MRRSGWPGRHFRAFSSAVALLLAASCAPGIEPTAALPGTEPTVRVGLVVDTATIALRATADARLTDGRGSPLAAIPANTEIRLTRTENAIAFSVGEQNGSADRLDILPEAGGFLQLDDDFYRGSASVIVAPRSGGLTLVNRVDMESYLLGVVPYEIGRVGPELLEASKAQAVAARTYAMRYLGRRDSLGFDVFATVSDQVYGGAGGEHEPVSEAVLATAGEVLVYDSRLIEAFYHSTCSGRTAAIEEVWPEEDPRPYLVSVVDVDPESGEAWDRASSRFQWTQTWSAQQLDSILAITLADSLPAGVSRVGDVVDLEVQRRTPSGRIADLQITTTTTTFHVGGDRIRWIFRTPEDRILNSSLWDVRIERDASGDLATVTAEGGGWGHGIGMCQVGAMGRARGGQDYRTILGAYYPGAVITKLY